MAQWSKVGLHARLLAGTQRIGGKRKTGVMWKTWGHSCFDLESILMSPEIVQADSERN